MGVATGVHRKLQAHATRKIDNYQQLAEPAHDAALKKGLALETARANLKSITSAGIA
jgi:hypothetical protein